VDPSPISARSSPPHSVGASHRGSRSPPFLEPCVPTVPSVPLAPSHYSTTADTYYSSHNSRSSSYNNSHSCESTNGANLLHSHISPKHESPFTLLDTLGSYPMYDWSFKQPQMLPISPPSTVPAINYYCRPRRLEEIAPRDTISLILALFFDFVYPLTPCIHKPSFMADLQARREEQDPLFFALVMSTVASTLVQVPRSYLPMERSVVRKLAQVCFLSFFNGVWLMIFFRLVTKLAVTLRWLHMTPRPRCTWRSDTCKHLVLSSTHRLQCGA
jgi:hypothetical protein